MQLCSGRERATDHNQGIALSLDQYNALLTAAPLLESVLSKKDVRVVRPDYDADPTAGEPDEETEENQRFVANAGSDADGE